MEFGYYYAFPLPVHGLDVGFSSQKLRLTVPSPLTCRLGPLVVPPTKAALRGACPQSTQGPGEYPTGRLTALGPQLHALLLVHTVQDGILGFLSYFNPFSSERNNKKLDSES